MKLTFGVVDIAYSGANGDAAKTTGEVAEILEKKYHVMETFWVSRQEKIADFMASAISDEIADLVSGRRVNRDPFYAAMENIEAEFRAFLDANEMAHLIAGLSEGELNRFVGGKFTGAAGRGVNHRKKNPYSKKNAARAAFVDTGLYQQSFKSWVSRTRTSE